MHIHTRPTLAMALQFAPAFRNSGPNFSPRTSTLANLSMLSDSDKTAWLALCESVKGLLAQSTWPATLKGDDIGEKFMVSPEVLLVFQ
jgi:hypothetical protein